MVAMHLEVRGGGSLEKELHRRVMWGMISSNGARSWKRIVSKVFSIAGVVCCLMMMMMMD